jgi:hypothetical protein
MDQIEEEDEKSEELSEIHQKNQIEEGEESGADEMPASSAVTPANIQS